MSRIGKQPINIPENVEAKVDGNLVTIKGPKGKLKYTLPNKIKGEIKDNQILIYIDKDDLSDKKISALWGLTRSIISNIVKGVTQGHVRRLEIEGIGYRASVEGDKLILALGHSHPVEIKAPENIEFKVEKNTITISGIDKELVGQITAKIRSQRKPEPYKGKGIRYQGEAIRIKAGKKAVSTEI